MLKDCAIKQQQGAVLIMALLLLLIMTLLGVSAMQGSVMDERMAGNMHDHNMAFQAAESGLRDGGDWLLSLTARPLPDGTAIEYVHDPLGRRIAKIVNGAIVEKYLWSGLTTLLAVYDGSDNLLMRFKYADGRLPVAVGKAASH